HVTEVDDAKRACGVVGEIDVMRVDVGTVHAAGDGGGVFRDDGRLHRIGSVKEDDAVFSIGSAFAADDTDFAVGSDADVVDEAGIDFERFSRLGMRGIADIVDENFVVDGGDVGVVVPDPFFGELLVLGHSVADDFDFAFDVARRDDDTGDSSLAAHGAFDAVGAGSFSDKCAVGKDVRTPALYGPRDFSVDLNAFGVFGVGSEVDDVAGFGVGAGGGNRE